MTSRSPHVVGIIQARMGSTRLPGKVLADLGGRPLLAVLLERVRSAQLVREWVIATSDQPADDAIAILAAELGVALVRGSEGDVLDRYYQASLRHPAEAYVRLTGDNPLVDTGFVDQVVQEYLATGCDYAAPAAAEFPYGISAEVFSQAALASAWREATDPSHREHVTPYLYREGSGFRVHRVPGESRYGELRFTVDTPEDLARARQVFAYFGSCAFSWRAAAEVARSLR